MQFHELMKKAMDDSGLRLDVVAQRVGVSIHAIYAWRSGERRPTPEALGTLLNTIPMGEGMRDDLRAAFLSAPASRSA